MAEQFDDFDDFQPVKVDDGVNDSVKKVVAKEMSELEAFKADNDDMIYGYDDPKQALTEMMVEYIQNVGDVNEVNYCNYQVNKAGAIDAWGFNGDEDMTSLDLFLTVLVDPEKSKYLSKIEFDTYIKRLEKFLDLSKNGGIFKHIEDNKSDLYQIAQIINAAERIDRVRLFVLTNAIIPTNLEIDEKETEEGTIIEYHLWDVKRIKKHDDILRGKETVVVDFEDKGFNPLPCIMMPDVSDRVKCYLAIIPGEILAKIYNQFHQHILEQNVRTFLQFKGASNKGMRDTLIGHAPTIAQRAKGDVKRDPEPDMFFSYNNGISTTAADIEVMDTEQGPVIKKIVDWQIVNGGQTTASISAVMKMKNIDPEMIKKVFVAMKVSVIKNKETKGDLVPRISQFANTQTAVKKSDFGINEPFLQELEQHSRTLWVKNSLNKEISKWFFERTRGQYMDMAKHTNSKREENEFYAEYPKLQMFDKGMLAKCMMSWEQEPAIVCSGSEKCYSAFYKKITFNKNRVSETEYKNIIAKLILFKAIDCFYGKEGVSLPGFKSQMVAYTLAALSKIANKSLDLQGIWNEQFVISSNIINELNGDLLPIYVKLVLGYDSITYKVRNVSLINGKRINKLEIRSLPSAEQEKIKNTVLYKTLLVVKSLHSIVSNHLFDVDAGVAIDTNSKKTSCWDSFCSKQKYSGISIPKDILSNAIQDEMTPAMVNLIEKANSYGYETWHSINKWGKETGLISPRDRAFMGCIYYWCKRGQKLSYKQAKYAMDVLGKARSKGWKE